MRTYILFLPILILAACTKPVSREDISHLEGIWEIEKVTLADGTDQDYKVSEIVDRFAMEELRGTRTKVRVSLDGNYQAASRPDSVTVSFDPEKKAILRHKAQYIKWQEEIVELDSATLVLRNQQGIEYRYKRHVPFTIKP